MADPRTPVRRFFDLFERNSDSGDVAGTVSQFADVFMAAGPDGAQCVRAADFGLALPKRVQLFKSLGCRKTSLEEFSETRLDARFVMAETRWRMVFGLDGDDQKEATADSLFIIDTATDPYRIVFYLAHQGHMAVLKELGLAPA
ncbi:MAG TPA: hypothetical protein VKR52_11045 [Terracidiphilus sp.]|nr:hypothetical protein [Terracidiphilus sp.]